MAKVSFFVWLIVLCVMFSFLANYYPDVGGINVSKGIFIYGAVASFILAVVLLTRGYITR